MSNEWTLIEQANTARDEKNMVTLFKSPHRVARENYFRQNGMQPPPYDDVGRYELALSLMAHETPDYDTIYALYDELYDIQNADFLILAGTALANASAKVFNLQKSLIFFMRAFEYTEDTKQKLFAAQALLIINDRIHNLKPRDYLGLHKNFMLFNAAMHIIQSGAHIAAMDKQQHNATDFYAASFYGAGIDIPADDVKSIAHYRKHIETQDTGFLEASYKNLAIRYALGMGTHPQPQKALELLEAANYLLDSPQLALDPVTTAIKALAEKHGRYDHAGIMDKFLRTRSPWAFFDIINDKKHDHDATLNIIGLLAHLAKTENWHNQEYWDNINFFGHKTLSPKKARPSAALTNPSAVTTQSFPAGIDEEPRLDMSPERKRMHAYFREHRLGIPPYDSIERLKMAVKFHEMIPPQYNHTYALYDPSLDSNDRCWLYVIAIIHDEHFNNPDFFDPEKAVALYKRAAELGLWAAASKLGDKYHTGKETEINLEEALKWYRLADELGDPDAISWIADIIKFKNELDDPDVYPYTDEIVALYKKGYEQGSLESARQLAKLYINGVAVEKDKNYALSIYNSTFEKKYNGIVCVITSYVMAIRAYLGLDMPRSNYKALEYLSKIPDKSNDAFVRYKMLEKKQWLKTYIASSGNSDNTDLALVTRLYDEPAEISKVIRQLDQGKIKCSTRLVNYITCMMHLAWSEEWANKNQWEDLLECALAKGMGLTFEQVTFSTLISGPRYTPLDHNGLPVLGVWEAPSPDGAEKHRVTKEAFVPAAGVIALKGIVAHPDHGISFNVVESKELPAMLLPQDFDIALILSFGHPDRVIWPSLSLEDVEDDIAKASRGQLQRKVFFPEWLGYSDFGRTLFTTDQLIGNWAWNAGTYSFADQNNGFKPEAHEMAKGFIRDIRLTGGRSGAGSSSRVMLCPEKFQSHIYTKKQNQDTTLHVDVAEMKMRVDGSYILEEVKESGEIVENKLIALNDTTFKQGRVCQKLTDHFDLVAKLDPRFERARQLMALFYSLVDLREKTNYKPPADLQRQLTEKLKKYEKDLGRLPKHELICRRIPFMR